VSSSSSGDNPVGQAGSGRERLAATYARPGSRKRKACQSKKPETEGGSNLTTDKTGCTRIGRPRGNAAALNLDGKGSYRGERR